MAQSDPCFDLHGPADPVSPVILSVPHAGRDYPAAMRALLRIPPAGLIALEDRHVDAVARAARRTETMLVARRARGWIDLNRSEQERDPLVEDSNFVQRLTIRSPKVRGGLGLIPRRAGGSPDIWRRRLTHGDVNQRIEHDHRPYHAMLSRLLNTARDRFGVAVLIDLHSMPPLGEAPLHPRIVLGDRFGKSASARLIARIEAEAVSARLSVAVNTPYPGGHILDRHGARDLGIHAVQIEIDRSLYLDRSLTELGPGLATTAAAIRAMIDAALDEMLPQTRLAAE